MSYTSYIQNFNFTSPDWEKIPIGLLDTKPIGLTLSEELLYGGIKMAYLTENCNKVIKKIIVRGTQITTIGTVSLIFFTCLTYYLNLNLNFGLSVLTELFT